MVKRYIIIGVCFILGCLFAYLYQPAGKTMTIYSQALQDYEKGDYQNSYYLFSKVSFLSNLKPYAIYRQSMCAKALEDKKSELKQYHVLINNYSKNNLSVRARYLAAQMLMDDNPSQAKNYFEQIIKNNPDTDYAIASEYFLGLMTYNKYKDSAKPLSPSDRKNIENAFRHYLKAAPQGRHALNVCSNWLNAVEYIEPDDYLLMANSYYLFEDYQKARELLAKTDMKESWILDVKNSYALKNYDRVKQLAEYGLQNYSRFSDEKGIKDVVDIYMAMSGSKTADIDYIYNISSPKGKDYIWSLKCEAAQQQYQEGCYKQLYLNFPNSKYGADAMANLFFAKVKNRDYKNAQKVGDDYLNKFENTPTAPMVMFWLGKVAERNNEYNTYMDYYKRTIANYPDTYYAYRAYLAMKHVTNPILNAYIKERPVVYPYSVSSKNDIVYKLAELKDFEVLEILSNDDFIKSWILYEKGEYSKSMLVARDAMEKLSPKPDRSDLRWRLVYPINYYELIKANNFGNNTTLMLALMREESYFNPKAQSSVGAKGLMQLMPQTAKGITLGGYSLKNDDDLFNPEINVRLGNAYYSQIKNILNNMDVSAIAAYNGGFGSVAMWKKNINYADTDEFVEQIPYPETKNYVKKVFRTYWNYLRLYVE